MHQRNWKLQYDLLSNYKNAWPNTISHYAFHHIERTCQDFHSLPHAAGTSLNKKIIRILLYGLQTICRKTSSAPGADVVQPARAGPRPRHDNRVHEPRHREAEEHVPTRRYASLSLTTLPTLTLNLDSCSSSTRPPDRDPLSKFSGGVRLRKNPRDIAAAATGASESCGKLQNISHRLNIGSQTSMNSSITYVKIPCKMSWRSGPLNGPLTR